MYCSANPVNPGAAIGKPSVNSAYLVRDKIAEVRRLDADNRRRNSFRAVLRSFREFGGLVSDETVVHVRPEARASLP